MSLKEFAMKEWQNIFISGFTRLFDLENIGVDTKIMIMCQFRTGDIVQIRFSWWPFQNKRLLRKNGFWFLDSVDIQALTPRNINDKIDIDIVNPTV